MGKNGNFKYRIGRTGFVEAAGGRVHADAAGASKKEACIEVPAGIDTEWHAAGNGWIGGMDVLINDPSIIGRYDPAGLCKEIEH